jgi:hypothetical protein
MKPKPKSRPENQKKQTPESEKETDIKVKPLVKVIEYKKIKKGDIIIIECEKGKENEFLAKADSELKSIITEKDLRILAVTPDFDIFSLKHVVEVIRDICNKEEKQADGENDEEDGGIEEYGYEQ